MVKRCRSARRNGIPTSSISSLTCRTWSRANFNEGEYGRRRHILFRKRGLRFRPSRIQRRRHLELADEPGQGAASRRSRRHRLWRGTRGPVRVRGESGVSDYLPVVAGVRGAGIRILASRGTRSGGRLVRARTGVAILEAAGDFSRLTKRKWGASRRWSQRSAIAASAIGVAGSSFDDRASLPVDAWQPGPREIP